jgi:hypothetical protein
MAERYDTGRGQLLVVTPAEPPRGPGIAIIIIVVVIILILLVVVIILILRRRNVVTGPPANTIQCLNNFDCSGNQVCSPAGLCVECLGDQDCPLSAPVCDTSTNRCGQCQLDTDCPTGAAFCNQSTKRCVACVSNSQCTVERPLCNPSNGSCVQCLNNGQCTRPSTCLNGTCCDIVAPVLTSLTSLSPGLPSGTGTNALVTITGTYTTSPGQPQAGQVAIAEISDRKAVALRTTSGVPAIGTITVNQVVTNENVRFYAGYPYQMRVRVSTPCGQTQYSNRLTTIIPVPPGAIVPFIELATGNRDGVVILLSNPPAYTLPVTWEPRVYLSRLDPTNNPDGLLDPNLMLVQDNVVVTTTPPPRQGLRSTNLVKPLLKLFAQWPSGSGAIQPGQIWWCLVGGSNSINAIVVSAPFQFTVTA